MLSTDHLHKLACTPLTQSDITELYNFTGDGGGSDTTPPSTPANLSASSISSSRIDLSWDAASDPESGISNYRLYWCQGSSCTPSTLINLGNTTSYSHTGRSANTTYRYQVSAVNGTGLEGSRSSTVQATTPASSSGNTYYVSTTGSDSNPGTQSQPWRTVQKAVDTVQAGDTVFIAAGTYVEKVVIRHYPK